MDRQTTIHKRTSPSCLSCKSRKIKCDRANPCSHCARSGAVCVTQAPSRAPRGRNGGRRRKADSELLERITKLEGIVKHLGGSSDETDSTAPVDEVFKGLETTPSAKKPTEKKSGKGLERYIGGSLFADLSDEINGLRDVLNQDSEDEEEDNGPSPDSAISDVPNLIFHTSDRVVIRSPTREQILVLYKHFISNVHPVVRILHGPSMHSYLVEQSEHLDCSPGPEGWEALSFAVYFTTVTSLTPEVCRQDLHEERAVLIPRFRQGTESALAKVDFVNTEDLSTLQALVLYLYAVRSNERSRRTWTLSALAVRIAQALGLNREYQAGLPPFDQEMRRRLWWEICTLDRNSSMDRGSDPMVTSSLFNTRLPLHVNDIDLIPDSHQGVKPRDEFTDMTLGLMVHEIFELERHLNYVPAGQLDSARHKAEDPWAQRRSWMMETQQRVADRYLRHCDMNMPLQRFVKLVGDIMLAQLGLVTYRPLQKHPGDPPLVNVSPHRILHLAVDVLEKGMLIEQDNSTKPFHWISTIWVQWHALAVMVAELCVQTEGPMVERAWAIQSIVYEETAKLVADSNKGRLWRPIKKMMNKALAVRQKHLKDVSASSNPVLPRAISLQKAIQINQSSALERLDYNHMDTTPDSMPNFSNTDMSLQLPQLDPMAVAHVDPLDWTPWMTYSVTPGEKLHEQGTELNQIAWTNWEAFINDYQDNEYVLNARNTTPPDYSNALGEQF